jgi:hypothetical protein
MLSDCRTKHSLPVLNRNGGMFQRISVNGTGFGRHRFAREEGIGLVDA